MPKRRSRAMSKGLVACSLGVLWVVACVPARTSRTAESAAQVSVDALVRPPQLRHCPKEMVLVENSYCIDRWEASLVEVTERGERPFSPYRTVNGAHVRAVSKARVVPQGYISREDAAGACAAAGKRLCRADEWLQACRGRAGKSFPYGVTRRQGVCNDSARVSPLNRLYSHLGPRRYSYRPMNDPRLNAVPGTLSRTGTHPGCVSDYGVYDLVGNLHEWVDDENGTFRGGYYLDTRINGEGCEYRTTAHGPEYHDYSTGFRCCSDASP